MPTLNGTSSYFWGRSASFLKVVSSEFGPAYLRGAVVGSGVATGWTGVDMSTPLLLEVAPEIDTNPTSFYRGRGRGSVRLRFALDSPDRQTPVISHVCPPHIF